MKYSEFERLVLSVGGVAVVATMLISLRQAVDLYELAAQLLLLVPLFGAVHWGRRGGLIAATAASFVYIALRTPLMMQAGLTSDVLIMLMARIVAYGLIGIGGGEVCARVKYLLARLQEESSIDEWSGVYNQRISARLLTTAVGRCQRYGEPFCIVTVRLSPELSAGLRDSRQRALVRDVANHIRNDVRMVDEVSRLDDGRFLILLPHAPKEGGDIVRDRLAQGVSQVTGAAEGAVETANLSGVEDAAQIDAVLAGIAPAEEIPPVEDRRGR